MEELKRADGKQFKEQDSISFLISEYEQCYEHLRHYDTVQNSLITFTLTGYIAVLTAGYTLYHYISMKLIKFVFLTLIFILSALLGIIMLMFLVRNRVYYTVIGRQVNSLRNYFLSNSELDFIKYNKLYLNQDSPRIFYVMSTYSLYMYVVSLLNSSLIGAGIVIFCRYIIKLNFGLSTILGLSIAIVALVLEVLFTVRYLREKEKQSADEAVWGSRKASVTI